jgi:hypothetical protein
VLLTGDAAMAAKVSAHRSKGHFSTAASNNMPRGGLMIDD